MVEKNARMAILHVRTVFTNMAQSVKCAESKCSKIKNLKFFGGGIVNSIEDKKTICGGTFKWAFLIILGVDQQVHSIT